MALPSLTVVIVVVVGGGVDKEAMYVCMVLVFETIDTFFTFFGFMNSWGLYRNVGNEFGLEFFVNYEIALHFHFLLYS